MIAPTPPSSPAPAPRTLPATTIAAGAGAVSALLLLAALAFQHLGGLEPCVLCVLQRWPHLVAAGAGAWVWWRRDRPDAALAMLVGSVAIVGALLLGGLHTGVEIGLWSSPFGCGMPDWNDPNLAASLSTSTPPDCSQPAWTFLGHSMAAWNTLFSCILAGMWIGSLARMLRRA